MPYVLQLDRSPSRADWTLALSLALSLGIGLLYGGPISASRAESLANHSDVALEPIVVGSPVRLEVEPDRVQLTSSRQVMHLIVLGRYDNGEAQDLTRIAEIQSSRPEVVRVEGAVVVPVSNGATEVVVGVGDLAKTIPVTVANIEATDPVSFRNETAAALTRQGCNSGACHGSPKGKGGFRLSLQAYDLALDQYTLIREAFGRRTNVLSPTDSLLLLKPTMQVPHGGGLQLRKTDSAYQTLVRWIAEGRRVDPPSTPTCVGLKLFPESHRVIKRPAHTQQLLVTAEFSDGSIRDVTRLATFSSSDETIAEVQGDGLVVGRNRGEAAIMVRYLHHVESAVFTFVQDIDGFVWNDPPENNYVDALIHKKLRQLQYLPAETCTDAEFIRRIFLDVLGQLPTIEEVSRFLDDPSPNKRALLIDALLERPEYARYWALHWGDLLRLKERTVSAGGVQKFHAWLVAAVEQNKPLDQFVRELLTADGSTYLSPAANYYRALEDSNACVETTAQLFMGVRIQCAKCHNHPFERWTQDNYYGMSAFFRRLDRKPGAREGELVVWASHEGEVTHPRTGKLMKPWLPTTGVLENDVDSDRRQTFASWLTQADNPYFAKVAVNRIWAQLLGRGLVEPVDDFRDSNPSANAELLDALADELCTSGFDQKRILRTILNSQTYQRSAATNRFNHDDQKYFSHAKVRFLSAEQLLEALCHVCGVPEEFAGVPLGARATHLPSPDVNHPFLKVFGQPERDTACACERSSESNLSQALELFSGPVVHRKLQHPESRFRRLIAAQANDDAICNTLYLTAFCRRPTDAEAASVREYLKEREDRGAAWEDICWSLMNTNEFLFQH